MQLIVANGNTTTLQYYHTEIMVFIDIHAVNGCVAGKIKGDPNVKPGDPLVASTKKYGKIYALCAEFTDN